MEINEARVKILQRVGSILDATVSQEITDQNIAYTAYLNDARTLWVRVTIQMTRGGAVTLGGAGVQTRKDNPGLAIIQVFSEIGEGLYENDRVCQLLVDGFHKQTGDRPLIYGGTPAGGEIGINDVGRDGAWYQQNVVVPFVFPKCYS